MNTMRVNNYQAPEKQKGSQPVRVLRDKIDEWFKNTYSDFEEKQLKRAVNDHELHEELNVIDREEKIASPAYVGTFKIISIQETYLSYLWCLTYSLIYIFDKTIHEPRTKQNHVISPTILAKAQKANGVFRYGLSLLNHFNQWDLNNLPNPEEHDDDDKEYIEKANGAFLHSVNFVLVHELGHVVLGHIDQDIESLSSEIEISNETKIQDEIDADIFSLDQLLKDPNYLTNDHTVKVGIVSALCSFIFFSANMKGVEHPDPDKRLQAVLNKLNLAPEDNLWGLSCLAFKLWSMENSIQLNWPSEVETYRDLFELTMSELENIKSN